MGNTSQFSTVFDSSQNNRSRVSVGMDAEEEDVLDAHSST